MRPEWGDQISTGLGLWLLNVGQKLSLSLKHVLNLCGEVWGQLYHLLHEQGQST